MAHNPETYQKAIETATKEFEGKYKKSGDTCLVAVLDAKEVTPPQIIQIADTIDRQLNSLAAKRPVLVRVLEVGPGYYNDDGTVTPSEVEPGDILLVGHNAVTEISQFGKLVNHGRVTLGLMDASQMLRHWKGKEAFDGFFATVLAEVNRE